jgi:hypothetical protein
VSRVRARCVVHARVSRVAAAMAVMLALGGCTGFGVDGSTPTPSPSGAPADSAAPVDTGRRVMIVVGPATRVAPGEAAALASAAAVLDPASLTDVAQVRVVRAQSIAFAADLVDLAVVDGYDLVCVVGTGTADILEEAARTHRAARFCGTDAMTTPLANAAVVGIDVASLSQVAAAGVGSSASPVGLVVGSTVSPMEPVEAAFRDALGPAPAPQPSSTPTPTPGPDQSSIEPGTERGTERGTETAASGQASASASASAPDAEQIADRGPRVAAAGTTEPAQPPAPPAPRPAGPVDRVLAVVSDGVSVAPSIVDLLRPAAPRTVVLLAPGSADAGRALADIGAALVVVSAWATDAEGQLPGQVLLTIRIDWAVQLRSALEDGLALEVAGVRVLGAADGLLVVVQGAASGSTAAVQRAQDRIGEAGSSAAA